MPLTEPSPVPSHPLVVSAAEAKRANAAHARHLKLEKRAAREPAVPFDRTVGGHRATAFADDAPSSASTFSGGGTYF